MRPPVKVTINGYSYRSTIASKGGTACIPLRKSNREAAGLNGNETLAVKIALDTEKREVQVPVDLLKALRADKAAAAKWKSLSYSHQREHVEAIESAKKPETRTRRIERALEMLQ
ncbi:MAG TPA: YdeI/OmpD-associated family protein [Povalibacter sp.]